MTFFSKMAGILSKGILSAFNDLDCSRFRRGSSEKFVSNSRLIGVKVKERIQVSAYLLKESFNQVFSFL